MTTLTITAKGQVTLKRDILDHLGARPGDRVAVEKLSDGRIEVRSLTANAGKISDVFGRLKSGPRRALSIDEIGEIAADGWARTR